MTDLERRCAHYLKSSGDADRIMWQIKRKYQSLGRGGGRIVIEALNKGECDLLRGILKRNFISGQALSLSIGDFIAAFDDTIYSGIALPGLLQAYYGHEIVPHKQRQQRLQVSADRFFEALNDSLTDEHLKLWLKNGTQKKNRSTHLLLMSMYKQDSARLSRVLIQLQTVLEILRQNKPTSLPIVAVRATKNPHALDNGTPLLRALLNYLSAHYGIARPQNATQKNDLLTRAGLNYDLVNSSVLTYGIEAYCGVDQKPLNWSEFYRRAESLALTRLNFKHVDKLGLIDNTVLYCFENPALFLYVVEQIPTISALCLGGQISATGHRFLTLLQQSKIDIYYHGDYDPEGLLILDKLLLNYDNIKPFGDDVSLYRAALSNRKLTKARLAQLKNIQSPLLKEISQAIAQEASAGYQEYVAGQVVSAIKSSLSFRTGVE